MQNIDDLTFISENHRDDLKNSKSPSLYILDKEYSILTLRLLRLTPLGLEYFTSFYIHHNSNYYYKSQDIVEGCDSPKDFYIKILNDSEYLTQMIKNYSESVELIEDKLFTHTNLRSLNSEIFNLKKDLLKIRRVIERLSIALSEYYKREESLFLGIEHSFKEIITDSEVDLRVTVALLDRLDTCFNYLNSIKNDALNKNIYVLSVISGIFLPLNLIVGFFGMNTNGLFLADHKSGTTVVFYTIVSIFLFLLIGIPLLNIINKVFVFKIFGRYSVYAKLSKKLEKVNDDFNILSN
jgi:magnesium transporter